MVSENTYVNIQAFMVNDLHLSGNELITYAVIYGFSQDGETWFTGSRSYLANWCQSSKKTISNNLAKLCEKGFIEKRIRVENGVTLHDYRAVLNFLGGGKKFPRVGKKVLGGREKSSLGGREKSSPHNIDIDNIDIKIEDKKKTTGEIAIDDVIENFTDDKELESAIRAFMEHRQQMKARMTVRALELMLKKLIKLSENKDTQIAILEQSIMRGWKGIFPFEDDRERGRVKSWSEEANRAKKPEDYDDWEW